MSIGRQKLLPVAVIVALMPSCEKVPLTAPAGSSVFLQANPPFVIANGGQSVVTALVVEPAGTLVPDGTECLFLTTLGRIDEKGKTVDGVARVYFVSDARSGTAIVTAICGAPAPAATTATSDGDTTSTTTTASGSGSATTEIQVGSALPKEVVVGADPQRITPPQRSTIIANVYDAYGNPVQNVPVVFRITGVDDGGSGILQESLASGGAQRFTDSNGQSFDTLHTSEPVGGTQKTVTIEARTSNQEWDTVEVMIN